LLLLATILSDVIPFLIFQLVNGRFPADLHTRRLLGSDEPRSEKADGSNEEAKKSPHGNLIWLRQLAG
jgi:hypothetical protein